MKHDTPRRGTFSIGGRRLLLVLCVMALGVSGTFGRGVPAAFAGPSPASTTLAVATASGTYGGTTTLSAHLTSGGSNVSGESVDFHLGANDLGTALTNVSGIATINGASLALINAGTYVGDVTGSFAGVINIFTPSSGSNNLTVNPAPLTITANNKTKVYGAALPTLTANYTGFVNGDTSANLTTPPTLTTTATAASHVAGSPYSINPSGAVDTDYTISYVAGSLTITTAPLTITANDQTKVYGAALPPLTASYTGFVNGDTSASLATSPTLTTTATAASHVSDSPFAVTASGAVDTDYTISYVDGSLSITTAPLTITADDQSKVYGAALPTLTASYSGLVNGDTSSSLTTQPTIITTADASSNVAGNPYAISVSGAADTDYTISYVAGNLTVTSAPLTITADNQTKVYGAALPTLTASYTGFVNGDTSTSLTTPPTITTQATAASHVAGSPYKITGSGAADPNYTISYVGGGLAITLAPLTISADNQTKAYGAALPTLTATDTGFVNGDDSTSLTTPPTITTTATAGSSVGAYPITTSGAAASDYAISYVPGVLTIPSPVVTNLPAPTKITPVLSWATPAAITFGTALGTGQLNASASVPGTFTYSSPAGSVLAVGTQLLTVLFVPFDTVDYNAASALVYLTVLAAPPVVAIPSPTPVLPTVPVPLALATSTPTTVSSVATPLPTLVATQPAAVGLVIHNNARTEVGGRRQACDLAGNTNGAKESSCEIVSSVSAPGASVTYTVTYADGSTQHFTDTADSRGHSLHVFNVAYRPLATAGHGTGRTAATILIQATLANGTKLVPVHVRFAVIR